MTSVTPRQRRRLTNGVKQALRDASLQVALLNHQVGARLNLRDADFDCLNLLNEHGPLGPGALAKLAGLHPATMTGVLDRLEKGGWLVRERDPEDRRSVRLRVRRERVGEIFALYSGMSRALDELCEHYTDDELRVIADFLSRATAEGRTQTKDLDP
jgi:DNA-binding MarR family transcriptional regulator